MTSNDARESCHVAIEGLSAPLRFQANAVAGDSKGVFDAAYSFGEDSELTGTPEEIGRAVIELLSGMTRGDVEEMRHGTDEFFIQITIAPID